MNKISQLEIAVDLFHGVNHNHGLMGDESLMPTFSDNYTPENENLMIHQYTEQIKEIAQTQGSYLVLVTKTDCTKGILHPNVREVFRCVQETMDGRFYLAPHSVEKLRKKEIEYLRENTDQSTDIFGWGEFTSKCVTDEIIRLYRLIGISPDYENVLSSLKPDNGIDIDGGYPRPWENPSSQRKAVRLESFLKNVQDLIINHKYAQ